MLMKEKEIRRHQPIDYEEKPRATMYNTIEHNLAIQATTTLQAQVQKYRDRINNLMDKKDMLRPELKEAKTDFEDKCKALQKMEGLIKSKNKEIMEMKAKSTSTHKRETGANECH
jgi:chromosome segregation ATPase